MSHDLFIKLAKYGATEERRQTENFLTEVAAHVLRHEPVAFEEFVKLVAGDWAKELSNAQVCTQCVTESPNARLNGLRLDLVLRWGNLELIVENKVDDDLTSRQLRNYLDYARERDHRRVALISKRHQGVIGDFLNDDRWVGETLWWEVADKWAARREEFSCAWLADAVLTFMRRYEMGPIDGFSTEEMRAPELWRKFVESRDGILERLSEGIGDSDWGEPYGLTQRGLWPDVGHKEALHYRGMLWNRPDVNIGDRRDTFWYFLGFRYSELEWYPPLNDPGQPECCAFVGVWGENRIEDYLKEKAQQLDSTRFKLTPSQDGAGLFLARRLSLEGFTRSRADGSAVLDFFLQSHEVLKSIVPEVRQRHLQLVANLPPGIAAKA